MFSCMKMSTHRDEDDLSLVLILILTYELVGRHETKARKTQTQDKAKISQRTRTDRRPTNQSSQVFILLD